MMSLSVGESFQDALRDALLEARLPVDVHQIVGRLFQFGCEHGSHHQILVGTVTGIHVSDEGGLELYVSTPSFWGECLISIRHVGYRRGWMAYVDIKVIPPSTAEFEKMTEEEALRHADETIAAKFFEGEFQLL